MSKVIKLFESCLINNGISRSIIYDTQRNSFYLIPNALADLFDENNVFDTRGLESDNENTDILREYIEFLFSNELCFYCELDTVKSFPKIDINEWDYPAQITNAIVEVTYDGFIDRLKVLEELASSYLTRHIEFHIISAIDYERLCNLLDKIDSLDLYSYNIIFSLDKNDDLEAAISYINGKHKIGRCIISNVNRNGVLLSAYDGGNIFLMQEPFSYKSCGVIDYFYFTNTIEHITESQNHNTCLNRKLTIDEYGNVKNCPNTNDSFGNILHSSLHDITNSPNFKKLWQIKKDEIKVCKDCEFRHICTDCRAFIENPEDIYSKPLKCGYNPYTCEWEEWSNNPLKKEAIKFYHL